MRCVVASLVDDVGAALERAREIVTAKKKV
jgi:hypothetical protein